MAAKTLVSLLVAFLLISQPTKAQQHSVDAIVDDLYESISFNENKDPDYEKFQSLFVEGGRLISVKDTTSYTLSPDDYKQSMTKQRKSGAIIAFEEEELHRKTEQYGNILHLFSTYRTHLKTPNGTDSARGINSIQLMKKDGSWKVVSLIWYEEDKAHPLPEKYLPSDMN
ncbi:MAG: hypothetical protein U5J63_09040 [Fodinibius sp.]|nr:hypothetical protein [Fodinibius sp.]